MTSESAGQFSLARYANYSLALILTALISAVAASLWAMHSQTRRHDTAVVKLLAERHAQAVSERLAFYQGLVSDLAARSDVHDLIRLRDDEAAEKWAQDKQKYLPQSIGLSLIGTSEQSLEDPVSLRLRCMGDAGMNVSEVHHAKPSIHWVNDEGRYFHVAAAVLDHSNKKPIGLLCASFDVDALQTTLEQVIGPNQYVVLRDASDRALAQIGNIFRNGRSVRVGKAV